MGGNWGTAEKHTTVAIVVMWCKVVILLLSFLIDGIISTFPSQPELLVSKTYSFLELSFKFSMEFATQLLLLCFATKLDHIE